ncbi:MAG: hypothetical protein ACK5IM_14685 [Demequina sp.]|uniref:hypothetical protein n=1 Tax=Demequina sp. TaxID=2050685 RepID=UPI003A8A7EFD
MGTPPRCGVCGARVDDDGALVDFVPREADLDAARAGAASAHPPGDAAWMCARHVACGWALSRRFDRARALTLAASADEGIDVRGQIPASIGILDWERVLRRALPDFAVELGSADVAIDEDWQTFYAEDGEIPPGASHSAEAISWSVEAGGGHLSVTRITMYWPQGAVARTEVHVDSVSAHAPGWRVRVIPAPNAVRFEPTEATVLGEPSPLMRDLLDRYGLSPTAVTT